MIDDFKFPTPSELGMYAEDNPRSDLMQVRSYMENGIFEFEAPKNFPRIVMEILDRDGWAVDQDYREELNGTVWIWKLRPSK